jgi:hypothetical protein
MKSFSKCFLMMLAQPTGKFLSGENHICPNWFDSRIKKSLGGLLPLVPPGPQK